MNYLQNFGKIIDLRNIILRIFARFLLINKIVYEMISVQCRRDNYLMNYPFFIILKLRYSQSVLFIYHLRKLRNAKLLQ